MPPRKTTKIASEIDRKSRLGAARAPKIRKIRKFRMIRTIRNLRNNRNVRNIRNIRAETIREDPPGGADPTKSPRPRPVIILLTSNNDNHLEKGTI